MQFYGGRRHLTPVVSLKSHRQFPLIILEAAMSLSPQTNTQPLWFCGVKAGSQLIRYSFSWLLRVPLSVTLLTHCHQTISTIFYSVYSAPAPWHRLQQCALYLCGAVASRRVPPLVLIRKFCRFSVWAAPWADHRQPRTEMDKKRTSKELDHGSHGTVPFYSGIQFRCQWRLWLSFWSELRCTFNLQGLGCRDSDGAGVTPEWQQVKSLISKIRSALLCLTSNKLRLTIKVH